MSTPAERFLPEWHRIVAERHLEALPAVLADDVQLGAPPYWTKLQGREMVQHLLGLIVHTIEDFTYHREWAEGNELALEFRGTVGGKELQGIDLITLNQEGRIQNLDVLMRPVSGIVALRESIAPRMAEFLSQQA